MIMKKLNRKYFYPNLNEDVKNNAKKQKYYYNKIPKRSFQSIQTKQYEKIYVFIVNNIPSIFQFYTNNSLKIKKNVNNCHILDVSITNDKCFMFSSVHFLHDINHLYVIDDIILNILSYTYLHNASLRNDILRFINNSKYIFISAELFYGDTLFSSGQTSENFEFIKLFLTRSIENYVLNTQNIILFYEHNIQSNYYPSYRFENILLEPNEKTTDLLFYGNNPKHGNTHVFKYRNNVIENLKTFSKNNNIMFEIYDNLYDKDDKLSRTKIVLQIPNYQNFHSYPWAKTLELISKKVFFIIEENEEMYIQKLNKKVVYYKRNDLTHLQKLINHYLKHENERERVVIDCFEYFKDKYNYSVFV